MSLWFLCHLRNALAENCREMKMKEPFPVQVPLISTNNLLRILADVQYITLCFGVSRASVYQKISRAADGTRKHCACLDCRRRKLNDVPFPTHLPTVGRLQARLSLWNYNSNRVTDRRRWLQALVYSGSPIRAEVEKSYRFILLYMWDSHTTLLLSCAAHLGSTSTPVSSHICITS